MVIVRWLAMLVLLTAAVLFAFYAGTGDARYKRIGFRVLQWTLIAGVAFFVVVLVERLL